MNEKYFECGLNVLTFFFSLVMRNVIPVIACNHRELILPEVSPAYTYILKKLIKDKRIKKTVWSSYGELLNRVQYGTKGYNLESYIKFIIYSERCEAFHVHDGLYYINNKLAQPPIRVSDLDCNLYLLLRDGLNDDQ